MASTFKVIVKALLNCTIQDCLFAGFIRGVDWVVFKTSSESTAALHNSACSCLSRVCYLSSHATLYPSNGNILVTLSK